ncbi:MAG: IS5 family transposase [Agrobacterium tumefaciens]
MEHGIVTSGLDTRSGVGLEPLGRAEVLRAMAGRPLIMLLSEGQMSDYKDAALMIDPFPTAEALLADRGYDADWFRHALAERGIAACIPSKTNRKVPIPHDTALYRQRHKVENMFGKLKDWRRIHTRYDRCAHTFISAICIAVTVIFWLPQSVLSRGQL